MQHNNQYQVLLDLRNRKDVREIVEVSKHNWFKPELKEQAIDAVEGFAHALYNNVSRVMNDYHKQAVTVCCMDKTEHALDLGRRLGLEPKLFSVLDKKPFAPVVVKSDQFDWSVHTINKSKEPIPRFALKNLTAFQQNGVVFGSLAIAAPYQANYLAPGFVFNQEAKRTLIQTLNIGKACFRTAGKASLKTVKAAKSAATTALQDMEAHAEAMASRPKEFVRDPVLLGSFGDSPCFMLEIARWL